ncbi:MAG: UDP-glucose 4-epimerase GalE [Bdellovibrio sp.]|nr:UDP-glucose 4-epimerase GalE [Bdellovibrio sp.]
MQVLVTGGAGYIGSHTVQKLLDAGYGVVVYDNITTGFREAIPTGAELVMGDVRDKLMLSRVMKDKKISAVVHFAAKLIVPESVEKPLDYYENNTAGVLTLAQACIENGVKKVVFSSTAAVYGDASVSGLITEQSPTGPLNPYGQSKLMSENVLRDCEAPHGLKSVCLRYFNVAGASVSGNNGQRTKNATHLIKVASEAACGKRESVGIFGTDYSTPDGTGVRDYIHVEDLADLHVLALKYLSDGGSSQIFNCGYGRGFSVRDVIDTVRKVSGVNFKVIEQPRRAGDAAQLVADSSKIRKAFAWTPKYDNLELICRTAYEWEKR